MNNAFDNENWTPERLQSLLDEQIPEDLHLDYKSAAKLPILSEQRNRDSIRKDIGKDATAFANSDGGVLIYGIRESKGADGRPIPDQFEPISLKEVSRDQLTQTIAANSEPPLTDIRVHPVRVPNQLDASLVCFVVVVPKSDTAHMAWDGRYYFRNEAVTATMRDWQVRDAMNRSKVPKFDFAIGKEVTLKRPVIAIQIAITNVSPVVASRYRITVKWPEYVLGRSPASIISSCSHGLSAETRNGPFYIATDETFGVFFPGMKLILRGMISAQLSLAECETRDLGSISIEMFADTMPARNESYLIEAIPAVLGLRNMISCGSAGP